VAVLLRATELVVAQKGFHAATTNRIAEVAGVSIGTLYHYFPTKEALVEAVVHRMWEEELAALEERGALLLEGPLDVAIRALVDALVAVIARRIELTNRWFREASHLGQLELGMELTDRGIALVRAALEHRRAEVRPKDLAFASDLVVKAALAIVRTAARDYAGQIENGALASELSDMLTRYLLKAPPA
jgi:AcrR family transcriptional regulator